MKNPQEMFKELDLKRDNAKIKGFEQWLANPQTKLLVSLIGPTEPAELLTTLLKTAYADGLDAGISLIAGTLAIAILENR